MQKIVLAILFVLLLSFIFIGTVQAEEPSFLVYAKAITSQLYKYNDGRVLVINYGDIMRVLAEDEDLITVEYNNSPMQIPRKDVETLDITEENDRKYNDGIEKFNCLNVVMNFAYSQLGKPYGFGKIGPDSFDCSGLVQSVYKEAGIEISRSTSSQIREGSKVNKNELKIGDLVFLNMSTGSGHVGLYVGDNKIIHSSAPGDVVKISDIKYFNVFSGGRRII